MPLIITRIVIFFAGIMITLVAWWIISSTSLDLLSAEQFVRDGKVVFSGLCLSAGLGLILGSLTSSFGLLMTSTYQIHTWREVFTQTGFTTWFWGMFSAVTVWIAYDGYPDHAVSFLFWVLMLYFVSVVCNYIRYALQHEISQETT